MSIFSTIGNDIEQLGENMALAVADGVDLMAGGWRDVFSGDFKTGLANIGVGLAEAGGLLPPQYAQRYENAVGVSSLWALRQAKQSDTKICYSVYLTQVISEVKKEGLSWNSSMESSLRSGVPQMPWINPGC